MAEPFSKERQLARGERRYRRKVASPKQWQAIIAAKGSICRLCETGPWMGTQYHHLIARAQGGDDVADNIVPLCLSCHGLVTSNDETFRAGLAERLTDAEDAYVVGKLGEGAMQRLFGV